MTLNIITTRAENESALAEVKALIRKGPDRTAAEDDRLRLLALLIHDYECRVVPLVEPDPVGAILFRMDQMGLSEEDLIPFIGSKTKVSEVLSGKRSLTLPMIRKLHKGLEVPLEDLIHEPKKKAS